LYLLPPPMMGFFQFSLMRVRKDLDQEALSELLYQYLNMESDFVCDLFVKGTTRLGRVMVGEEEIPDSSVSRVLNYERASEVIKGAWKIGIGRCSCRQRMHHLDRACSAPMETCMVFDGVADALIRHGHAREIDQAQCLDILQQAREQNLIQFAENVQTGVTFICNCCACCCDALTASRKFSAMRPVQTTSFVAKPKRELCSGCGTCVDACPVSGVALISANDPQHPWKRACVHDARRCLGCGTCARVCRNGAITLAHRRERVITPVDSAQRVVLMALEGGKLQHLICDSGALSSHRTMSTVVGAILRLPSVKQSLAASQLGSSYLKAMSERYSALMSGARRY
jgi:ferredoxin